MIGYSNWTVLIVLITWITISLASKSESDNKPTATNACTSKQTCHACIQMPSCAWCSMPGFDNKRCFFPHVNTNTSMECPEEYLFNPDNEYIKIKKKELTKGNTNGNVKQDAVQLYPQEVNLKLRINEVQKIKIEYAQAEDYPVDLYYLMDLSHSMLDDKQKLSDLGVLLGESMSNITNNFRLGFGSFVDKVVMPYVSMVPNYLKNPCHPDQCEAPYGYRNHMPLSQNTSTFAEEVSKAPVSGNLDGPEGGFDAIMQAIVCRKEIGWRDKARKLLLFSTDDSFHYAGDGKLGGIVKPNDGLCHLDYAGLYTHSTLQDYPSISQINKKVKENSVNIIWAVTMKQMHIYNNLIKHIEGSYAAELSNDSSNIVDLVRDQYNTISSSIEMKDTASNNVNLKYFSNCLDGGPLVETNRCDGLKVGNKVEFSVEIGVSACPENRSEWIQKFYIYPVGLVEKLTVNLEMICDCDCERPDSSLSRGFQANSEKCGKHGDLSCGICDCNDGYFGKQCECDTNDKGSSNTSESACRRANDTIDCSGKGTCECNECNCETRQDPTESIWGQYCECDNFSCDRKNNELCSGLSHGKCVCGVCVCEEGWSGKTCECSTNRDTCNHYGVECSGHGVCECGKCKCNVENEMRYSGLHCEICRTCPTRCEELKPCAICQYIANVANSTSLEPSSDCNASCSLQDIDYEFVDVLEVDVHLHPDEIQCLGYDKQDDCRYYFNYYHKVANNKLAVRVGKQRECPSQVKFLAIVLGVIAAVVLIGLALLLLWKLLTTIHDRREFAKFDKERMMAKWDASENPIYKQATSTFKNPMYTASNNK